MISIRCASFKRFPWPLFRLGGGVFVLVLMSDMLNDMMYDVMNDVMNDVMYDVMYDMMMGLDNLFLLSSPCVLPSVQSLSTHLK